MNALAVTSVACLVAVLSVSADTNTEQIDGLDADALSGIGACLLDDAACSEHTSKLKGILLEAFHTKCSKCTETQKGQIRRAMKTLIANRPEVWQKVLQTYDPEGKRAEGLKKFFQAE